MCGSGFEKKVVGAVTLLSILIVGAISACGLALFIQLHLKSISNSLFYSLITFLVVIVVILFVCIYCLISYGRLHRMFLLAMIVIFITIIGCLAFGVFTFRDDILLTIGALWDSENKDAAASLEKMFDCKGFDSDDLNGTCAGPIKEFLDKNTKILSMVLGSLFIVLFLAMFFVFYISCRTGTINTEPDAEYNQPKIQQLEDIETPLNIDDNVDL
ncbi:hypothetical protein TRFO_42705 [Tritrichomonas foetus]|uniref:Tetraspanin family protein n=1 Tax=Tritrichomonas foetus TaxID=1144522 RepID=A0A1J4KZK1_9EUKA|nr:hypothetical protein TRFO_42705 [Tritrichomonas foetus]|eukprot:OHT15134.1 hypothetical protein TRFO_42705 [Tritrichomonas foetus]